MRQLGEEAPRFVARDQDGKTGSLEELVNHGPIVLYFYPKDFTPGCTIEACSFRDAFEDLIGLGATIVGVSADDEASHKAFASRYRLPFSLLADPERSIARDYGVIGTFLGFSRARRVTFLIGRDRRIRGVFHHELRMGKHVEDVRRALGQLAQAP